MDYRPRTIEQKWKAYWEENQTYKVSNDSDRPKYYVLDMFPYPSGAGLHVGHPLGYIASDIFARYKRLQGFNVLHPMGYDAFGLPAEQYAIQTGVHPAISTAKNISRYREQLDNLGFSFDWSREVQTSDPNYYKWTQWIFLQLFHHYYDQGEEKAVPVSDLVARFASEGNAKVEAATTQDTTFTAAEWNAMTAKQQDDILMNYRLAYRKLTYVNWCEALGTVLANDEVKDGVSERGGYPVERKPMLQWSLRITAYAERLLNDLQDLEWSEAMKKMQSNWIGRSTGAQLFFDLDPDSYRGDEKIEIYTTRPDTIFGATYMVLAPEHDLVAKITTPAQQADIDAYLQYVNARSERERMSEVKEVTGAFTGAYAINPFNGEKIPVWIGEYVLKDYGTGAIMAVPADDERDRRFAEKFGLPIIDIIDKSAHPEATIEDKVGKMINSDFMNGMEVLDAIEAINDKIEEMGIGGRQINYKLRDAIYSRQRYWGEPFPVRYDADGVAHAVDEADLPLTLPDLDDFKPASGGKAPLARAEAWVKAVEGFERETDTMPGFAGSSWYFLRYMDAGNPDAFASQEAINYWQDVDLYVGGTEHAVGHLMYSRFWHKFLFDKGLVPTNEPFKKLINQGMIQGVIEFIHFQNGKAVL
jgi:leucyl-tRNA synthetase